MSRKLRGTILIILGFILVFTATGIFAVYDYQDKKAGENAAVLLEQLKSAQKKTYVNTDNSEGEMPQQTIMGYNLIGTLSVPSCGIELPVLGDWSYEMLKISPCRYSGSIENDDLIILGHNYENHFKYLKNCSKGDYISFTDINGKLHNYTVDKTETLYKTELDSLTSTDYPLTIFTCTPSGQSRLVLRCVKNEIAN